MKEIVVCDICKDEGWVCEEHPDQPWGTTEHEKEVARLGCLANATRPIRLGILE